MRPTTLLFSLLLTACGVDWPELRSSGSRPDLPIPTMTAGCTANGVLVDNARGVTSPSGVSAAEAMDWLEDHPIPVLVDGREGTLELAFVEGVGGVLWDRSDLTENQRRTPLEGVFCPADERLQMAGLGRFDLDVDGGPRLQGRGGLELLVDGLDDSMWFWLADRPQRWEEVPLEMRVELAPVYDELADPRATTGALMRLGGRLDQGAADAHVLLSTDRNEVVHAIEGLSLEWAAP